MAPLARIPSDAVAASKRFIDIMGIVPNGNCGSGTRKLKLV